MTSPTVARALILGAGETGLAAARWLSRQGVPALLWDPQPLQPAAAAAVGNDPGITFMLGDLPESALSGITRVVKSPGWPPHKAPVSDCLRRARQAGLRIEGELDLFQQALADLAVSRGYHPEVLCITGTNGKTTTTAWTAHLLRSAGLTAEVAGNIGPSLLQALMRALDEDALPQVWVLELSSFQLHDAAPPVSRAAALTNLTPDHEDWHGSLQAYVAAKARIFSRAGVAIINAQDPYRDQWAISGQRCVRVGISHPQRPSDWGLMEHQGHTWLAHHSEDGMQPLCAARDLSLRGRHNAVNALMALALAHTVAPLTPALLAGLRDYPGEAHRLQWCGSWRDINAYNDSKGTNVAATEAGLVGLGSELSPGRLVVILGGDGKGQDFTALREPLMRYARAVALIGRDAPQIQEALQGSTLTSQHLDSLEAAVAWCFQQALPGDAVVLSPACASWDMFNNYKHRGEVFVAAVAAWCREKSS